ncbi:MAG: hypothetical protein II488_05140 [Firmicutes bacterium]|nr:hypothetical protein [Bacillota bacterium]
MAYSSDQFVYVTADNGKVVHIPLSEYLSWDEKKKSPDEKYVDKSEEHASGLGSFVYVTKENGKVMQLPAEKLEQWEEEHANDIARKL